MKVYGIIGDARVRRSLSPAMHNAVMAAHGLDACYVVFPVEPEAVGPAVAGLRALGVRGVNVTVPHKRAVVPHLDELCGAARELGAVNTIVRQDGRLIGHNTDVGGFAAALEGQGFDCAGASALVLGAGGAARAVVLALRRGGAARVWVAGRSPARVQRLARELGAQAAGLDQAQDLAARAGLVVNATSVSSIGESAGMAELVAALPAGRGPRLVVDINYGRQDNFWQAWAAARGDSFMDGLAMLAHQARLSFGLWTGLQSPVDEFLRALGEAA